MRAVEREDAAGPRLKRIKYATRLYGSMVLRVGAVGPCDVHPSVVAFAEDAQAPRVAADLAVLNERAPDVRFKKDLDALAAIRAGHDEVIVHGGFGIVPETGGKE